MHMLRALHMGPSRIYICTTRDESERLLTEEWLDQWDVPHDTLMMAQVGDSRTHPEIKYSMVEFIRADGYDILMAVDDRPSVVRMSRRNGIPCLAMCDAAWHLPWNKDE
jgi:uncharacterized HAD superfamily protein